MMAIGQDNSKNKETVIHNVSEYIEWIDKLGNKEFLFRGQGDKDWPLRSAAVRRICGEKTTDSIKYTKVKAYIEELLETVKEKEFNNHNRDYNLNCDLKILAQLQHWGAATPLLDFSKNSLIALWMACADQPNKNGKVFVIDTGQENIKRIKTNHLNKKSKFFDLIEMLNENRNVQNSYYFWIWEPSHFNRRIPAQTSVFFFAKEECSIKMDTVSISCENKITILNQLKNMFGLKEDNVFPDFPGFAQANSVKKTYFSKDEHYYFNQTAKLVQLERFSEAIETCNHAIKINESFPDAFATRAYINNKLGKLEEALKDYDKAIELNPQYVLAYNNRGNVKHALNRYKEAIKDHDKAIELDPGYFMAYCNRGNVNISLKQYEEAIKDYSKAIELNPGYFEAYCGRGDAKGKLKRHKEAIKDYSKAIELNPSYFMAYYNRGNAKAKLKQYEEAIKDYNKTIELKPKYSMAYCNRGVVFNDIGDRQNELKDYNQAIALDAKNAIAYNNRGLSTFELGDLNEALKDYNKAIELDTSLVAAYINRGNLHHKLRDNKKALEDYNKALQLEPDSEAYSNRSCIKSELDDNEGAIEDCNKAIELNIESASVYNNRGVYKTKLKQYKEAREDLLKAKRLAKKQEDSELLKVIEESLQGLDENEKKTKPKIKAKPKSQKKPKKMIRG